MRAGSGFRQADDEPGEVVVAERVHARHLRRLSTQQRASGVAAGLGHAFDQLRENVRVEAAGGEVVEEEQGPRAGGGDVVHAVVDDVDADAAVLSRRDGDLDLRPHAVGARGEVAAARQRVQPREGPHTHGHVLAVRGGDQRFDPLQDPLVSLDVDPGRGVRQAFGAHQLTNWGDGGPGT